MSNEMIVPNMGMSKYADDKTFELVASAGNFLPRVQLFGSNAEVVKTGAFPMAHYGLAKTKSDALIDLGKECNVFVLGWRPLALKIDKANDSVVSVYNPNSPDFKKIAALADVTDSGCMYGQRAA